MPSSSLIRSSSAADIPAGIEVLPGHHGRLLDEAVLHRRPQRVIQMTFWNGVYSCPLVTYGVAVSSSPRIGLQLVDCPHPRRRPVPVRLVHQQHKILQSAR